ncbi:hypothetical protein DM02DRAFT_90408 [Periconia macrospinosa]|uniref:Uncharacterized protein n=1 Tax=Periconia macrospinosa TaxID=97972 RepID=A0A2V1DGY9_9PLEO|nr:hypothetical protein DM02DRAFT_90408 [Periconia macrospinosa]
MFCGCAGFFIKNGFLLGNERVVVRSTAYFFLGGDEYLCITTIISSSTTLMCLCVCIYLIESSLSGFV